MEGNVDIQESQTDPVLADIPISIGENRVEEEKKKSIFKNIKIPWLLIGIGSIAIMLVGGISYAILWFADKPDLVLKAPEGSITSQPTVKSGLPVFESTRGAMLADTPYVSNEKGFSIKGPEGWVLDDSGKTGADVVFLNPKTWDYKTIRYVTLINVMTHEAEGIVLEDQVAESKKGLFNSYSDFELVDDFKSYISGRTYYEVGGTYSTNDVRMRVKNLVTIYDNMAYVISASGPLETWEENDLEITTSMYSFRLL